MKKLKTHANYYTVSDLAAMLGKAPDNDSQDDQRRSIAGAVEGKKFELDR